MGALTAGPYTADTPLVAEFAPAHRDGGADHAGAPVHCAALSVMESSRRSPPDVDEDR
jgi:hypothetical protein